MNEKLAALKRLLEIVDILRGPEGCPWDKAQKMENMGRYLLEEASEVVDALEDAIPALEPPPARIAGSNPPPGKPLERVSEELGDLLMNILLLAKISEDGGGFDVADVANGIARKLVRRHPHVFGTTRVKGVDEVLANWNAIKEEEKKAASGPLAPRASRLDGVPRALPPLQRAFELGRKAAKAGFDWQDPQGALDKVREELAEVEALLEAPPASSTRGVDRAKVEEELGDLLFALVSLCRKLDVAPDSALRRALGKFCERFQALEERIPNLEGASLEDMEAAWQEAKSPESKSSAGAKPSPSPPSISPSPRKEVAP
jgi:tetrapyrrole methylase family protein/MazG family protein